MHSANKDNTQCDAKGSCAWPRPQGAKHILLVGAGCPANASAEQEEMARSLTADAPKKILGTRSVSLLANAGEEFHDPVMVSLFFPLLDMLPSLTDVRVDMGREPRPTTPVEEGV